MANTRPVVPSRTPERIGFASCVFAVLSAFALLIAPGAAGGESAVSGSSILALFVLGSVWSSLSFGAGMLFRKRRLRKEAELQAYKEKLARAPIDW